MNKNQIKAAVFAFVIYCILATFILWNETLTTGVKFVTCGIGVAGVWVSVMSQSEF